jgi:hypothetical protein
MGSRFLLKEDIFKNSKLKHSPKVTTYIYFNEIKASRKLTWFELNSTQNDLYISYNSRFPPNIDPHMFNNNIKWFVEIFKSLFKLETHITNHITTI